MGNLDFTNQPEFSWYCVLLLIAGAGMIGLNLLPRQSKNDRIISSIFGIGFLGYALYLIFVFNSGTYVIFLQAFIIPVVVIVNAFKSVASKKSVNAAAQQYQAQQQMYAAQQQQAQAQQWAAQQGQAPQPQFQGQPQIPGQAQPQAPFAPLAQPTDNPGV